MPKKQYDSEDDSDSELNNNSDSSSDKEELIKSNRSNKSDKSDKSDKSKRSYKSERSETDEDEDDLNNKELIKEEMEKYKHLWEDSVQVNYIMKKIVLLKEVCTCSNFIGKNQKKYQDLIEHLLDNERNMLEREYLFKKRLLGRNSDFKMKEVDFVTEAQLQAQYRLLYTRDCCLIKLQCPPMPYINNKNGRAFVDEKIMDRPIIKAGVSVTSNKELPAYPTIRGYIYDVSPPKQTVALDEKKEIQINIPEVKIRKNAIIRKIKI